MSNGERRRRSLGAAMALAAAASAAWAEIPPAQIRGQVSLGRNRPVVGAVILVRSATDPGPIWVTASDEDGRFEAKDLPDGTYRVEIRRDGLSPFEQDGLVLKAPFRGIVEAILKPVEGAPTETAAVEGATGEGTVRLTATVLGPGGEPAVGAELRLIRDDGALDPRDAKVGPGGALEIADLAVGRWRVELLDPGAIPLRATVDIVEDATLRVRLVAQPADFQVALEDLVPRERPLAPPEFPAGR